MSQPGATYRTVSQSSVCMGNRWPGGKSITASFHVMRYNWIRFKTNIIFTTGAKAIDEVARTVKIWAQAFTGEEVDAMIVTHRQVDDKLRNGRLIFTQKNSLNHVCIRRQFELQLPNDSLFD